jgi:inorganic pyrophosphatase
MNLDRVTPGKNIPDEINAIIEIPAQSDPVDVLVITPVPLISGSVIRCRPICMMQMTDESGPDAKAGKIDRPRIGKSSPVSSASIMRRSNPVSE